MVGGLSSSDRLSGPARVANNRPAPHYYSSPTLLAVHSQHGAGHGTTAYDGGQKHKGVQVSCARFTAPAFL